MNEKPNPMDVYRNRLREHIILTEGLKAKYAKLKGIKKDEVVAFSMFDGQEYEKVKLSSAKLNGMEEVLSLSEEDVEALIKEIKAELNISQEVENA